jgi:Right handed beta helix region
MRRLGVIVALAVIGALFVVAGTASASGNMIVVGTFGPGCNATAATIQAGVTAATSGTTVSICPGTYTEQVTIPAGKSNIVIKGMKSGPVTVLAPASMTTPKAIFLVNGATGITLRNLTISGPGGGSCDSLEYGVRVDNSGSATITHDTISDIRDNPFSGCQNGVGVEVGRSADSTTGSATIDHTTITGYQKNGIAVSGSGSSAMINHNTVTGAGLTSTNAQNGIQVSSGATATVTHNTVSANAYGDTNTNVATGILLFDSGVVTVDHNGVKTSDVAIFVFGSAAGSVVDFNRVSLAAVDGIDVSNNSSVSVHDNKSINNGADGIWTDDVGNTFSHNRMSGNGGFDADDESPSGGGTAGTSNTWTLNNCHTSSPDGLCAA